MKIIATLSQPESRLSDGTTWKAFTRKVVFHHRRQIGNGATFWKPIDQSGNPIPLHKGGALIRYDGPLPEEVSEKILATPNESASPYPRTGITTRHCSPQANLNCTLTIEDASQS